MANMIVIASDNAGLFISWRNNRHKIGNPSVNGLYLAGLRKDTWFLGGKLHSTSLKRCRCRAVPDELDAVLNLLPHVSHWLLVLGGIPVLDAYIASFANLVDRSFSFS